MTDRELMQQALEALESVREQNMGPLIYPAKTALRERLAQPEQEPVAWVREHELPLAPGDAFSWVETFVHKTPLYTTPPQRKPLTDEEILTVARNHYNSHQRAEISFARAIEAKLREKNGGGV